MAESHSTLSLDDTEMEESQMDPSGINAQTAEKLVADMDYSLLAVDMQKLLHISRTGVSDNEQSSRQVSDVCVSIKMSEMEDIANHKCLFCTGNFTAKDLLSKHILRIHHKDVINVFSQYSSSHEYLKCPFCVFKMSVKHKKLFLLHLEKKHSFEFVASLEEHFSSSEASSEVIEIVEDGDATEPGKEAEAKLDSPFPVKAPILHKRKGTSTYVWNRPTSNPVRRKQLEKFFQLQPSDQLTYLRENAPRMNEDLNMADSIRKKGRSKKFVCGSCQKAFSHSTSLTHHINISHQEPLELVQPLYHCGVCKATFFQSRFLIRHCFCHHS